MRFFRRGRWDAERAREIGAHLEIETDENVARGMTPEEARLAARRKLGSPLRLREEIYDMNTIHFVETTWQDLKYGARLLRLNPVFAAVAILSLALGVGANTAIFQIIDAVRLRSLPLPDPDRLVEVRVAATPAGRTGRFTGRWPMLTQPLWEQIRQHHPEAFSNVFAWESPIFNLTAAGEARYAQGLRVSGEFFPTLGVNPFIGRLLGPDDDVRGCGTPAAVVSYGFWQRELGGEAAAVGRSLNLDGHSFEVVGVTPPRFFGMEVGRNFDVVVPLCSEPTLQGAQSGFDKPDVWFLAVYGRLKPGRTEEQASAQLAAISPTVFQTTLPPRYKASEAKSYLEFKLAAFPGGTGVSSLRRNYETPLWLLLAITGLVLLIACANLANLMLARATSREREIAVRLALGASRRRVVRQMLAESLLLAGVGAALGALVAQWLSRSLVGFLTTEQDGIFVDLTADARVFAFTAALAVLTCLLFGLAPALRATATAPGAAMRAGGRGSDARGRFQVRRGLVVLQVALSLVLVVGALLFVRSLRNLNTLDAGFRQNGILVVSVDLRRSSVPPPGRRALFEEITERVRAVPGVDAAAEVSIVPVSGSGWNNRLVLDGTPRTENVNFNRVSSGYFKTMGTPLLAGRDFEPSDTTGSAQVAVVTETFVKMFLEGRNPIGETFQIEEPPGEPRPAIQIVGLVKDTKYTDLREPFTPIAFLAATQETVPEPYLQVVLRSGAPLTTVQSAVTHAALEISPTAVLQFDTMAAQVRKSLLRERLMATLSGLFGLLAALIATIGLYGVMSYMVARRKTEIGIRMALGADRGSVVRMVLREAGVLLAGGLIVGTILAVAAGHAASALLFGLQPWDPSTLALAAAVLAAVAMSAGYVPALRASRLEPTVALRED
jgi:putative ABC transport system permease protein